MKETPILMSTEMVRAYLEGKKTMTRRVIKPQPLTSRMSRIWRWKLVEFIKVDFDKLMPLYCPYGQVSDALWWKETWMAEKIYDNLKPRDIPATSRIWYWADGCHYADKVIEGAGKIRPSIFMPRRFSRITTPITGLRVERLQEITEEDAINEGVEKSSWKYSCAPYKNYLDSSPNSGKSIAISSYMTLWDSLNAKRGYPWANNDWVWVIEFPRIGVAK